MGKSKVILEETAERKSQNGGVYPLHLDLVSSEAQMLEDYPHAVSCKPFTVAHIKSLVYAPDDEHYPALCVSVVNEVIDFDSLKLTVMDFDHLVLFLRVNSCGKEAAYTVTCPACKKTSPFNVDLTALDLRSLPKDFKEPKELNGLKVVLPRMKTRLEFRQLEDPTPIDSFAQYILEGSSMEEKIEILNTLEPAILSELADFASSFSGLGVTTSATFKCEQVLKAEEGDNGERCRAEEALPIPFRLDFFLPEHA